MKEKLIKKELEVKINTLTDIQAKKCLLNIVKVIPQESINLISNVVNVELGLTSIELDSNDNQLLGKLNKFRRKFKAIDELELYFSITECDYISYSENEGFFVELVDDYDIGKIIDEAYILALSLLENKEYKYAKELFDLIIYTNYQYFNDGCDEYFNTTLEDIASDKLVHFELKSLALYTTYVTYQLSSPEDRAKLIYKYFNNDIFKYIKVNDVFELNLDYMDGQEEFWKAWIDELVLNAGNLEYRLLKEAVNVIGEDKILLDIARENYKMYPQLYLDYLNYLKEKNAFDELIQIGNEALENINKTLPIRSEIALLVSSVIKRKNGEANVDKYFYEAFVSKSTVPNFLRIVLNKSCYLKYKEKLNEFINKDFDKVKLYSYKPEDYISTQLVPNCVREKDIKCCNFFVGNFDKIILWCNQDKKYTELNGQFIQDGIFLLLLYLYTEKNLSFSTYTIISRIFSSMEFYKEDLLFLKEEFISVEDIPYTDIIEIYYDIFLDWKKEFFIDESKQKEYLEWLTDIIHEVALNIVGNGQRRGYNKIVAAIVMLAEIYELLNLKSKAEIIESYKKEFSKDMFFKKTIKEFLEQ